MFDKNLYETQAQKLNGKYTKENVRISRQRYNYLHIKRNFEFYQDVYTNFKSNLIKRYGPYTNFGY